MKLTTALILCLSSLVLGAAVQKRQPQSETGAPIFDDPSETGAPIFDDPSETGAPIFDDLSFGTPAAAAEPVPSYLVLRTAVQKRQPQSETGAPIFDDPSETGAPIFDDPSETSGPDPGTPTTAEEPAPTTAGEDEFRL